MTARADHLRLVPSKQVDLGPAVSFCGHCGQPPPANQPPAMRVCPSCEMGLLLHAPRDVAPAADDAFLVVDGSLAICAVSRVAERVLGEDETELIDRHVGGVLVPADAEGTSGAERLANAVAWAARGDAEPAQLVVRPAQVFGVRYWARVGPCGPSRAALLVLGDRPG